MPSGKRLSEAGFGQPAQIADRGLARRHQFLRILVAQFVERELAARRDCERLVEQRLRIELREVAERPQMALAVGMKRVAGVEHRHAEADRGERVLQRAALGNVHVHVAPCHQWQTGCLRKIACRGEPLGVVGRAEAFHHDPRTAGKTCSNGLRVFQRRQRVG